MPVKIKEGVYWVGVVDWNLRNFHGYSTHRGGTYNAYLVVDEEIALIDTVKLPFYDEMMGRIREIVDPSDIDYVISNHSEPDHSSGLPRIMEDTDAEILASKPGTDALNKLYGIKTRGVGEGDMLSLGLRTLKFIPVPMVHWPDSMVSYLPEERMLFSNDAFGQHIATSERFDDEADFHVVMEEAQKYYANIIWPYSSMVQKVLAKIEDIPIEVIAPSHGIIWREHIPAIIKAYHEWSGGEAVARLVVVYDTMWGNTEKVARAITEGATETGVEVRLYKLSRTDRSDVISEVMTARGLIVGSPTLNNGALPTVSTFTYYLKGLAPHGKHIKQKTAAAFGSYGWAGGAVRDITTDLKSAGMTIFEGEVSVRFAPTPEDIEKARELGRAMGRTIQADKLNVSPADYLPIPGV